MMRLFRWSWIGCGLLAAGILNGAANGASWYPLGPYGGSARSLAADPANYKHLFLGTATGWIYDSRDGGTTWNRVAQISKRNDLVIDHILVDAHNPKRLIVGAYTVGESDGGIFISEDYGKDWYSQAEMRGQSVRSLTRGVLDPRELVAGTLRGVFRSDDNGVHWRQISPVGNQEIKEVQSVAIDPADSNVIYAGTWHLPWKTTDGGQTWSNIKDGIIDDSDVFSIIVDPKDPKVVYASACSGIYKSTDAGSLFHKVQGIPSAARRTRTLEQDPENLNIVFAGTTEGLYRTTDAGAHWDRLTSGDIVVNDVFVDPDNSLHVIMVTDRGGVYRSDDGGTTFEPSNQGFSARQVTAFAADSSNPTNIYVGVVNDKTEGGVFESPDGGVKWQQEADGLGGRDVFSLVSLGDNTLLAGTGHGIFRLQGSSWVDASKLVGPLPGQGEHPAKKPDLPVPTRLHDPTPHSGIGRPKPKASASKLKPTRAQLSRKGHLLKVHTATSHTATSHTATSRSATSHSAALHAKHTAHTSRPAKAAHSSAHTGRSGHLVLVHGKAHYVVATRSSSHVHPPLPPPHRRQEPAAGNRPVPPASTSAHTDRLDAVIYALIRGGDTVFAGSSAGLLRSTDAGGQWSAVNALPLSDVHFLSLLGPAQESTPGDQPSMLLAGSLQALALSRDGGETWNNVALPPQLTQIGAIAIDSDKNLWVGGREGIWLSTDSGATWQTLRNLFLTQVDNIYVDGPGKRLLVTASNSQVVFSVTLPDHKVTYLDTGWKLRFVRPVGDHLIGATLFDGVVVQPKMVDSPEISAPPPAPGK